jgi:hypothetical protein
VGCLLWPPGHSCGKNQAGFFILAANFCRNFRTFGLTTKEQYGCSGLF